jgi:hypothetical protein
MRTSLCAAALVAALVAVLAPSAPAGAQPLPAEYTLTLSAQEVQIIGTALAERPYREVAGIIARLNAQIIEQAKARAPATPPAPPAAPENRDDK